MRRKVIKQGNHSYTLTLPIKWIREAGLENGNEVNLTEMDASLLISSVDVKLPETSLSVDVSAYNKRSITIILHQAYRKGFDKIVVTFSTQEQLARIESVTKNTLLGFEIVSVRKGICTIQNIAEPSSDKHDVILRKEMLLIKEEGKEILRSLQEHSFDFEKRKEMRASFVKYNNFTRRIVVKDKLPDVKNSYLLFYFLAHLSILEGSYFFLFRQSRKSKAKCKAIVLTTLERVNAAYVSLYDAYYKKDLTLAHR
jgi:antitoxin component of MazEF toxin-antitoxin module